MGLVIAVATIASYGVAWWIVGLWAAGHGTPAVYAVAFVVLSALLTGAWRRMPDETPERRRERARRGNIIGLVTGVQGVLILLTVNALGHAGRDDLLTPVIAVIMGLHFLVLAVLFPARVYYVTAALLVALGLAGPTVHPLPARLLVVSVGAASLLWLTCIAILIWPESRRSGT